MIKCDNIIKSYWTGDEEEIRVLKSVSFSIKSGEFVAIIGPSGSGKSTLMNIIGLLDRPTSGSYFLDNQDVSKLSDDESAEIRLDKIGFVFQSFNLLPRTSILRNVELPLIYKNIKPDERKKKAENALLSVEIPESKFYNLSNQISGGQMQRVAIARALINDPSIILADEPTGNLDTKTGFIVLDIFKKLNREQNRTILLITHELDVAKYADRLIRIVDGQIVEDHIN